MLLYYRAMPQSESRFYASDDPKPQLITTCSTRIHGCIDRSVQHVLQGELHLLAIGGGIFTPFSHPSGIMVTVRRYI